LHIKIQLLILFKKFWWLIMTIIPREIVSMTNDYFRWEIVQFKQHTFSRAFMVWIFYVLTYMHLHAREIRLIVYQTIKWHLLKQVELPRSPRRILSWILLINSLSWLELLLKHVYCWYCFLILLLITSIGVFLIAIFSQIS
jgi:hypothetical protein